MIHTRGFAFKNLGFQTLHFQLFHAFFHTLDFQLLLYFSSLLHFNLHDLRFGSAALFSKFFTASNIFTNLDILNR